MSSLLDAVRQNVLAANTVVPSDVATLLESVAFAGAVPAGTGPFDAAGSRPGDRP